MGEYFRTGLNHERTVDMRNKDLLTAAEQRYKTAETGQPVYGPGQNDPVFIEGKESNDFYQTERGKVPSNDRRTTPATYAKFMNFHPFIDIQSISPRPILFVVGEVAPSRTLPIPLTKWRQSRRSWWRLKALTVSTFTIALNSFRGTSWFHSLIPV